MTRPGNNRVAPGAERGKKKEKRKLLTGGLTGVKRPSHVVQERHTCALRVSLSLPLCLLSARIYTYVQYGRAYTTRSYGDGDGYTGSGSRIYIVYSNMAAGRATISRDNLTLARSCERSRGVFCSITRNRGSNLCSTLYMGRERGGPITRRRRLRKRRVFDN